MASRGRCRDCGAAIPPDGPVGLCAKCLLSLGFGQAQSPEETGSSNPESQSAPSQSPKNLPKAPPAEPSTGGALSRPVPTEKPGDEIRGYKLLEQIGHGGFGVVYLAEQKEPVKRRVAFKIIKLGMDTRQVVARFEAERQALALMDHPNIAKILEAGATETGRPYFVMELVGGIRITEYCDRNQFTTRQRLDLFVQVCRAVQHAHQKGVIHRDIKPSNVLVANLDGVAVPKVIDFGIAKATQGHLTDDTVFTAFEQFLGTPAYMSPEQAQPGGLDVDTRSDIYSLGVLLYELLTGKTPFDAKELLAAGLDAMRRRILENEPPTPSTRLKQQNRTHPSAANDPSRVTRHASLDKDLDWIVMKCLEKDRARRYETANGLATDIERHLKHEPVVAGPPSRLYRFQKMIRRNRIVATSAAVVGLVLILGVVTSTWQAVRARRAEREQIQLRQDAQTAQANEAGERGKAQREAVRSQQVAKFLTDMLQGVGPSAARGRDTTMLREILDRTAERMGQELANEPGIEADLRSTIGQVYLQLGAYTNAETMLRRSLALRERFLTGDSPTLATTLDNLGFVLSEEQKLAEADAMLSQGLAMRQRVYGNESTESAQSMNHLGLLRHRQERAREAEGLYRQAIAIQHKLFPQGHPELGESLANLSFVLRWELKLQEAVTTAREALEMRRKLLGNEDPAVAQSLERLTLALDDNGQYAEAEERGKEAVALYERLVGPEHPGTARAKGSLAGAIAGLSRSGVRRLEEAEVMVREVVATDRRVLPADHPDLGWALYQLAGLLEVQGRLAEAELARREVLAIRRKALPTDHPAVSRAVRQLADVLERQGKLAEVRALYQQALAAGRLDFASELVALNVTTNADDVKQWRKLDSALSSAARGNPSDLNKFAWLFATCPDADVRDGSLAVAIARKAVLKNGKDAVILDTLAAAYAAAGQFTDAVNAQKEALTLVSDEKSKDDFGWRLELYESGFPFRSEGEDGMAPAAGSKLQRACLLQARGVLRAQCCQVQEAIKDLARAVELSPHDYRNYQALLPLVAYNRDVERYCSYCKSALEEFRGTTDPRVGRIIAVNCLTLACSGIDLSVVDEMAQAALTVSQTNYVLPYSQLCKGLAEYRQGHFEKAMELTQKVLARLARSEVIPPLDTRAYLLAAMAQTQLGHPEEARAALKKAVELIDAKMPRLEAGDLGVWWREWLTASPLMREAKALVENGHSQASRQ